MIKLGNFILLGSSALTLCCSAVIQAATPSFMAQNDAGGATTMGNGQTPDGDQVSIMVKSQLQTPAFELFGDFLYWTAYEDNLEYALVTTLTLDSNGNDIVATKPAHLHFKWDPGFRIGTGFVFDDGQFDSIATWTHFHTTASGSKSFPTPNLANLPSPVNSLLPLWFDFDTGNFASSQASAHWNLTLNTVDLDFGRNIFVMSSFMFKPFAGLRGAWISQDYGAKYTGAFSALTGTGASPLSATTLYGSTKFNADYFYRGIGLHAGLDFQWDWVAHFGTFGRFSGSLLYGQYHVTETVEGQRITPTLTLDPTTTTFKDKYTDYAANFEGAIGLMWETNFSKNRHHVAIQVAYEFAKWFDQNPLADLATIPLSDPLGANLQGTPVFNGSIDGNLVRKGGDLSMQGLSVRLLFDF
jgi:hypothetical protein